MKEKILILVKTYPNSSKKYGETVCTAGINEKNEWRRLYPIAFRSLKPEQKFSKFSWIEVDLKKHKEKLNRKESFRPYVSSLKITGELGTGKRKDWFERNKLILPLIDDSLEFLKTTNKTLGLIKPFEVIDFVKEPLDKSEQWEQDIIKERQTTLTGAMKNNLELIPWKFSYKFKCTDSCTGHKIMCEDWELIESWRSWRKIYKTDEELWQKIKQKYFDWMKTRNFHFIVGTESRFNKFLIIGLYYPPK